MRLGQLEQFRMLARARLECRGEQSRGIQWLQQVVTGGGHEARLARVGGFGLLLGDTLRLERLAQFARALRDPLLEPLLGIEQPLLRALEFRDVGIGRDEAAARHRLAVNAVDLSVAPQTLEGVGGAGAQCAKPLLDMLPRARRRRARRARRSSG